MKKAAIYMRVSTAHQEEEQTIGNQKMEILERVEKDADVVLITDYEYKDAGWSGAIIERPDLDRMRSDAREGKFEVLFVYDRGRLSRKFVHQEIILEEFRECGIECISLHDINGQTTEEVLMGRWVSSMSMNVSKSLSVCVSVRCVKYVGTKNCLAITPSMVTTITVALRRALTHGTGTLRLTNSKPKS